MNNPYPVFLPERIHNYDRSKYVQVSFVAALKYFYSGTSVYFKISQAGDDIDRVVALFKPSRTFSLHSYHYFVSKADHSTLLQALLDE